MGNASAAESVGEASLPPYNALNSKFSLLESKLCHVLQPKMPDEQERVAEELLRLGTEEGVRAALQLDSTDQIPLRLYITPIGAANLYHAPSPKPCGIISVGLQIHNFLVEWSIAGLVFIRPAFDSPAVACLSTKNGYFKAQIQATEQVKVAVRIVSPF